MEIVRTRVAGLSENLDLNAALPDQEVVEKVCTIFRELRSGATLDGKQKLKSTSGVLSTAEAISLLANSMALAGSSETDGSQTGIWRQLYRELWSRTRRRTPGLVEYLENIMKKRGSRWLGLYQECRDLNTI